MKMTKNLKIISTALWILLFINASCFENTHYQKQHSRQHIKHGHQWRAVQEKARDSVVQIFVQTSLFNWLQPFKSPSHKNTVGSGFFIDDQGHIISNFHVIEQACGIKIQIPSQGKEQFDVCVVGVCPSRDIALLKLTDQAAHKIKNRLGKIPYLELGNSDGVVRTQEILAMGYPLGQERLKSTHGIVSGREMLHSESYIQMTAPLNRGNSGGPSFDHQGHVIGINTVRMASAQNVGYIIPINDIKNVIKKLYTTKLLHTPILGAEFNYSTESMLQFFNNQAHGGLYISRIYKNTLFDRIGIQESDMICAINNYPLDLYGETHVPWSEDKVPMSAILNRLEVGQPVSFEIFRKGKKHTINFNYAYCGNHSIRRLYPLYEPIDFEIFGGMVVMPLTLNHLEKIREFDARGNKDLFKYEKLEHHHKARLVVTHIFPTSQTQEARCVMPGDIITHINGIRVKTLEALRTALLKSTTDPHLQGFVTVKTENKNFMVLALDRILADEERLSNNHLYKKTRFIKNLIAQRSCSPLANSNAFLKAHE